MGSGAFGFGILPGPTLPIRRSPDLSPADWLRWHAQMVQDGSFERQVVAESALGLLAIPDALQAWLRQATGNPNFDLGVAVRRTLIVSVSAAFVWGVAAAAGAHLYEKRIQPRVDRIA